MTYEECLLRTAEHEGASLYKKLQTLGRLDEVVQGLNREQRERMLDLCEEVTLRLSFRYSQPS